MSLDERSHLPLGISVCICTVGRTALLRRCLESVHSGSEQPTAVYVSDDAGDDEVKAVCTQFGSSYVVGPGGGICANRNHVIRQPETSHVMLLDDDVEVGPHFVRDAFQALRHLHDSEIACGIVVKEGIPTSPIRPGYLGFFVRATPRTMACFHLNANLIPINAFDVATFDERIEYGYEDMDLATRLLRSGYEISYWPHLVTYHPQPAGPDADRRRHRQSERARYLVALKRERYGRAGTIRAGMYALVAGTHSVLHAIKVRKSPLLPIRDMLAAWNQLGASSKGRGSPCQSQGSPRGRATTVK